MKAVPSNGIPGVGEVSHREAVEHRRAPHLVSAPRTPYTGTAPERFRQAVAHVRDLERVLASSQQQLVAAQRQVRIVTKSNAQLPVFTSGHEHEATPGTVQSLAGIQTAFCLFTGLDPIAGACIERLLSRRIRIRKHGVLYRLGDPFDALFAIRTGSCKTIMLTQDGHEQVTGYHMAGEVVGLDGIATGLHQCQTTALDDMEVWPLPFDQIEDIAGVSGQFRRNLHKLLAEESARSHALMLLLGTMRAEQRLAVFLLELSERYQSHGFSSCEFVLRMTRADIGSYLGLKLETVSRLFSRFHRDGMIQVQGRCVKLLDRAAMARLVECSPA